jgi:hypothetical protein
VRIFSLGIVFTNAILMSYRIAISCAHTQFSIKIDSIVGGEREREANKKRNEASRKCSLVLISKMHF